MDDKPINSKKGQKRTCSDHEDTDDESKDVILDNLRSRKISKNFHESESVPTMSGKLRFNM